MYTSSSSSSSATMVTTVTTTVAAAAAAVMLVTVAGNHGKVKSHDDVKFNYVSLIEITIVNIKKEQ